MSKHLVFHSWFHCLVCFSLLELSARIFQTKIFSSSLIPSNMAIFPFFTIYNKRKWLLFGWEDTKNSGRFSLWDIFFPRDNQKVDFILFDRYVRNFIGRMTIWNKFSIFCTISVLFINFYCRWKLFWNWNSKQVRRGIKFIRGAVNFVNFILMSPVRGQAFLVNESWKIQCNFNSIQFWFLFFFCFSFRPPLSATREIVPLHAI